MKPDSRKGFKVTISAFAASLLVGALSSVAMAQNTTQIDRFDNGYLSTHPDVAQQLSNNPSLVDNQQWMNNHPGLQAYLAKHPEVRSQLKTNPSGFMGDESQLTNGQYGNSYFSQHPKIEQELQQNPSLVNNPQFMTNHPGLQSYLNNHPQAMQTYGNQPWNGQPGSQQHPWQGQGWQGQGWHGQPWQHADAANCWGHPGVAGAIRNDPSLANNPQFDASHPGVNRCRQDRHHAWARWRHNHPNWGNGNGGNSGNWSGGNASNWGAWH